MSNRITPKPSDETLAYYRQLLTDAGVPLYDKQNQAEGRVDRIVLGHTQGYVPDEPNGWVDLGLTDTGGQTAYVLETAKEFARDGRQVTILAQLFGDAPPVVKWSENVTIVRIPPAGIAANQRETPFVRKEDLYAHMHTMSPDAVAVAMLVGAQGTIGNYADGGLASLAVAEELGIPFVFIAHSLGQEKVGKLGRSVDDPAQYHTRDFWFGHRRWAELAAIRGANFIASNSPEEATSFEELYHVHVPNQVAMPAGVTQIYYDAQKIEDPSEAILQSELLSTHGLKKGKFFVSWGRVAVSKNIPGQVEVLAELKRQFPETYRDHKLVIIGGNPKAYEDTDEEAIVEPDLQKMVQQYVADGVLSEGDVIRIGSLKHDVIVQMAALAAAYVGTQKSEPFGMAPAENMALGKSLTIISQHAGISRWIKHGVNGLLIDPKNPAESARVIHGVLSHPESLQSIVDGGVKVAADFTWGGIARQQAALLDAIAGKHVAGLSMEPTPLEGRGYHLSMPVWYGENSTVTDAEKEMVTRFVDGELLGWLAGAKEVTSERVLVSVAGERSKNVADYLSTVLFTRGVGQERIPYEVARESVPEDAVALSNPSATSHVIAGAAINLRGAEVLITDEPSAGATPIAIHGDLALGAGMLVLGVSPQFQPAMGRVAAVR